MTEVSAWNAVDASNNAPPPDGWPEGQAAASVNDCARMMMGALRREHDRIVAEVGATAGTITTTTINAASVSSTGPISSSGTITGANIASYGNASVAGTLTYGALSGGAISASSLTASGTVQAGGFTTTGNANVWNLTATGTVQAAQLTSTGAANVAGTLTAGNLRSTGDDTFDTNINVGVQGYKPGGGTWAAISDMRTKRDVEAYSSGLVELNALQPVRYRQNGRGGMRDTGAQYVGLVADDARQVMPELVGTARRRLDPDDAEPTDLLTLDATPVIFALINAVKELTARLETLEAGGTNV